MLIFHWKYVQMCPGYKLFQNVEISFEICVNVFQLIQNVNISFEICANVLGSPMDLCKDLTWILCGGTAGRPLIIIWISYGSFMEPYTNLYGSLYDPIWVIIWIHISKIIEFHQENVKLCKNIKKSIRKFNNLKS